MLITKELTKRNTSFEALVHSIPWGTFARMFSSNAAKQFESATPQAGKTAAKDIGMKAIDAGKKLVEKAAKRLSKPKWQVANVMILPEEITKQVNEVITKYVATSAINLNKLINGSSVNRSTASNRIVIHDLAKRLNESGLKVTFFFFFF